MCELLGLNFNQPVHCQLSFRGFRGRGRRNPHGWGIARFDRRACQVFKEPIEATTSPLAHFLPDYKAFRGSIFVGHVRYATMGRHTLQNTHPFSRTFRHRDLVFAHNGTVAPVMPTPELKFHPVGETDSEYLFCSLLTRLSRERVRFTDFELIEEILRDFNEYGAMNLLFSEGKHLYCYHDMNGYSGLCMTERRAPFEKVSLLDDDWEVDLAEEKHPEQRGVVIATQSLTSETWNGLAPGALCVFKNGESVYGELIRCEGEQ